MEFEEDKSNPDEDDIENILEDIALGDESSTGCFAKRDNTIFIVDCSKDIMAVLPGQNRSEFDKVMESYKNFMMSKVIANCSDRVGLIFYNVNKKENSLSFPNICTVHKLEVPSARMIKSVDGIRKNYFLNYGHSDEKVPLHNVLWLFGQEIKDCEPSKNHARLFLFTAEDQPHSEADQRRQQAINHARQLASKGAHIELFPIKRGLNSRFDLKKFYQEIVAFDPEDLNKNLLDSSSKIMDLQSRIRQKEFKKRTLSRLLMQIGEETFVGAQIYAMFAKAKRPPPKKLQSSTNKPLKRVVKRSKPDGSALYNEQIGTYYPLGGGRVRISKDDMNQIKGLKKPGITLIGFKPKRLIKPYHNLRPSYFIYPDEDHVSGSTQFFDALIEQLSRTEQVAIVSLLPRANQQLRFAALFPQKQSYDVEDHHQTPPGFHMIILPYADDIVNFANQEKVTVKPAQVSNELVRLTKLIINNLTVTDFDFRDFENPNLQKFYCHLQAHALNQQVVEEKKDTIQPDYEGFDKFSDIYKMIDETTQAEVQEEMPEEVRRPKKSLSKKEQKKEEDLHEKKQGKRERKSRPKEGQEKSKRGKTVQKKESQMITEQDRQKLQLVRKVQTFMEDGNARSLKTEEMVDYLRIKKLDCRGSKGELADRIMIYISFSI